MNALYRYVFSGLGILMVLGMITILLLAVMSQTRHESPQERRTAASTSR